MKKALAQKEIRRLKQMMLWENKARENGFCHIAGVDEAGRGPLAGPVVAAACVLPGDALIEGIDDSKKLLPSQRYAIYQKLIDNPEIDFGVGIIESQIIDQINILQATFQAMLLAISNLKKAPDYLFVDGNLLPATLIPATALIQGDSRSQSIAAASIIAKETRDQIMKEQHVLWPEYGFDSHKGYVTKEHIEKIKRYGPCLIHRMSFEPLKSRVS